MQEKDRVNLADYLKADAKAFHQSDDWGFVFDEKVYPNSKRSTQENLVSHIQASCQEQGTDQEKCGYAGNKSYLA